MRSRNDTRAGNEISKCMDDEQSSSLNLKKVLDAAERRTDGGTRKRCQLEV